MPVLPVPMIIALILFALLAQRLWTRASHATLLSLIAVCATQAAIIALVQYYEVTALRPLQALLAMCIPPIAWFAFSHAADDAVDLRKSFRHLVGPLVAIICLITQPFLLDVLIPLSFVAYGSAILLRLSRGEDSLLHSRLDSGAMPLLSWRVVAMSLIASAICDVAIAYNLATGQHQALLLLPSVVSSLSLLSLGVLSMTQAMESPRDDKAEDEEFSTEDAARDQAIIEKLDSYVAAHKPHLDPDLTLSRLARKLVVPAKQLSSAINRVKSENVSRFINRLRIEHACQMLQAGHSVTAAMLESGFNTKSNFNREFLRIKNVPPSKWSESNTSQIAPHKTLEQFGEIPISVIQPITKRLPHD